MLFSYKESRYWQHSECFLQVEIEWEKAQFSNFCEIYD